MNPIHFPQNPSTFLEQVFNNIYDTSMRELTLTHRSIRVEAVGFHDYEGHWLGMMITPWFLNLMLLPKKGSPWPELVEQKGNDIALSFPCGVLKFTPRVDPDLGSHLVCSLASPMDDFADHAHARKTALEILASLNHIPLVDKLADAPELPARRALFQGELHPQTTTLATGYDPSLELTSNRH